MGAWPYLRWQESYLIIKRLSSLPVISTTVSRVTRCDVFQRSQTLLPLNRLEKLFRQDQN